MLPEYIPFCYNENVKVLSCEYVNTKDCPATKDKDCPCNFAKRHKIKSGLERFMKKWGEYYKTSQGKSFINHSL